MSSDGPRAATEAAIEQTERERIPAESIYAPEPDVSEESVVWETGGAVFSVSARDDDSADRLVVYHETDPGDCEIEDVEAFEIDHEEFREALADEDAFRPGDDLSVGVDDLEWFETDSDTHRADGTPKVTELERIEGDAPFEYLGEYERPGVRAVVSELREIYRTGTAVAGEFALADDELVRELWEEDGLEYARGDFHLGETFLRSDAVAEFLATASPDDHPFDPENNEPYYIDGGGGFPVDDGERSFERTTLQRLDGRVAESILMGGAYEEFEGDHEEAKALGAAFSHAIRNGDWSRSLTAYTGWHPWSEWFVYTDHWDTTVVVEDREAERIRLFAATDSD